MIKVLSSFVTNPHKTFSVRVNGDSMIDANIQHGDLLVVEQTDSVKDGGTVIALVYGTKTTCKRFIREVGGFYLKSENPLYDDIRSEEIEIQGVVKKLIREDVF